MNFLKPFKLITVSMIVGGGLPSALQAQDASFGCKVLLCAAASTPGWAGIPYCVPVMQKLFTDLARGQGWPSCPEGGSNSGLGNEPYKSCPAGQVPYSLESYVPSDSLASGYSYWQPNNNGNLCGDPQQMVGACTPDAAANGCQGNNYLPTDRPINPTPYYVDLTPRGQPTIRFWFNLNQ